MIFSPVIGVGQGMITHQPYPSDVSDAEVAAAGEGIHLEVVKLLDAKLGFVLLLRRWVVERSFGWAARFSRLAKDNERLSTTLESIHYVAYTLLMLQKAAPRFAWSS